jgi:hypothetical protein
LINLESLDFDPNGINAGAEAIKLLRVIAAQDWDDTDDGTGTRYIMPFLSHDLWDSLGEFISRFS